MMIIDKPITLKQALLLLTAKKAAYSSGLIDEYRITYLLHIICQLLPKNSLNGFKLPKIKKMKGVIELRVDTCEWNTIIEQKLEEKLMTVKPGRLYLTDSGHTIASMVERGHVDDKHIFDRKVAEFFTPEMRALVNTRLKQYDLEDRHTLEDHVINVLLCA